MPKQVVEVAILTLCFPKEKSQFSPSLWWAEYCPQKRMQLPKPGMKTENFTTGHNIQPTGNFTHKIIRIATARRDSSEHAKIMLSVCLPIQSIRPNTASDSIRMNSAAKNSKVDHSTRARTASISSRSANISSKIAPNNAVQPKDSRWIDGTEWRKKNVITNTSVTADLMSRFVFRIGYWKRHTT